MKKSLQSSGVTVLETVIALGAISVFFAVAVAAMSQLNLWATQSRLQTLANGLVQERIHEALSNPWAKVTDPWPVTSGTETNLFLNSETGTSGTSQNVLSVPATRITLVEPMETAPDGTYRLLRVTGTVRYNYRGKTYELPFATMRTCDTF